MPLSFALRNHSPKQIPHKVATGHIPINMFRKNILAIKRLW